MILDKSDRSDATQRKYQEARQNNQLVGLENEPPIVEYTHWKLIVNAYPYDKRWDQSLLLVSKYNRDWSGLSDAAIIELHELKIRFRVVFDKIEENGNSMVSVQDIPHVHLLKGLK